MAHILWDGGLPKRNRSSLSFSIPPFSDISFINSLVVMSIAGQATLINVTKGKSPLEEGEEKELALFEIDHIRIHQDAEVPETTGFSSLNKGKKDVDVVDACL